MAVTTVPVDPTLIFPLPACRVVEEVPAVEPKVVVKFPVAFDPSANVVKPAPPARTMVVVAPVPRMTTGDCRVVMALAPVLPNHEEPLDAVPMVMVPEVVPGVINTFPVVPVTAAVIPPVPDLRVVKLAAPVLPNVVAPVEVLPIATAPVPPATGAIVIPPPAPVAVILTAVAVVPVEVKVAPAVPPVNAIEPPAALCRVTFPVPVIKSVDGFN